MNVYFKATNHKDIVFTFLNQKGSCLSIDFFSVANKSERKTFIYVSRKLTLVLYPFESILYAYSPTLRASIRVQNTHHLAVVIKWGRRYSYCYTIFWHSFKVVETKLKKRKNHQRYPLMANMEYIFIFYKAS